MTTEPKLSAEDISQIIKDIVYQNEDAFQDAWVKVLETPTADKEEIQTIARDCRKKYVNEIIQQQYSTKSMDAPLTEDGLTLKDILPSPNIVEDENEKFPVKQRGRENKYLSYKLDAETAKLLKDKYPDLTYTQAIRRLVGLPISRDKTRLWQSWEDEILKKLYPTGGTFIVRQELTNRNANGITARANELGIKFKRFKPSYSSYTIREVCDILVINHDQLSHLVKKGLIESANPFRNYKLFSEDSIKNFLKKYPFEYRHTNLALEWRQYVPKWVWEWKPPSEVAKELHISKDTVRDRVRLGMCPHRSYHSVWYVRTVDVKQVLGKGKLLKQPYKVGEGNPSHYIFQDSEGNWLKRCKPNGKYYLSQSIIREQKIKLHFALGYPTCKVCLSLLNTYKRTGKLCLKDKETLVEV